MLLVVMRPADVGKDVPTPNVSVEYATLIERLTELRPPVRIGTMTTMTCCASTTARRSCETSLRSNISA